MNVDEMRKYIEQTPELQSALSKVQPAGCPLVTETGEVFWWAIEIAKDFSAFEARIRKENYDSFLESQGACAHCDVSYPFPVEYHHTEDECASNINTQHAIAIRARTQEKP